jgi:hypothetical protein
MIPKNVSSEYVRKTREVIKPDIVDISRAGDYIPYFCLQR